MKTIIECGANKGNDTFNLVNTYPGEETILYAIEPTYELVYNYLYPKFKNDPRVRICQWAIDIENTFRTFNVASKMEGAADWGCSSLHEFTDNIHELWPDRPDFEVTHRYTVPTMTLWDFCNLYGITSIDYLWIDTQGNDFNVLKSLKEKISIVKEGRCEVANTVELYKNTGNTKSNVETFLTSNGFEIETVGSSYEADIFFKRK